MPIVELLTPPPGDAYASEAAEQAQTYVDAFARVGLTVRPRAWTDAGDAPALALLAWGYHLHPERWAALLDSWPADVPLFNPAPLMRWNTRKTYLAELDAAGVPTVPTWFGDASARSVAAAFGWLGADELVVKPQVSAGSHATYRVKRGEDSPDVVDAMIQPFLPAIQDEGEYSLFYIDGAFSHAICKVATNGDFRIQPQFGGVNARWEPDEEAKDVAEAALAAAPGEALYARIDLLRRLDGHLALIEFEAIEPDLYFHHGEHVLDHLAEAVSARL
ncbi:RimK family alpha-L-glutamate ligase [Sphingomonas tabacisoli]|uniref:RimK family alpha-L-glutamate ligase n=1 Tax=Sphingomonas tabacisoli TaxID=2249466 RepID=A0ABW4I615_9SPHN